MRRVSHDLPQKAARVIFLAIEIVHHLLSSMQRQLYYFAFNSHSRLVENEINWSSQFYYRREVKQTGEKEHFMPLNDGFTATPEPFCFYYD
jgi:hypothetical protein